MTFTVFLLHPINRRTTTIIININSWSMMIGACHFYQKIQTNKCGQVTALARVKELDVLIRPHSVDCRQMFARWTAADCQVIHVSYSDTDFSPAAWKQ